MIRMRELIDTGTDTDNRYVRRKQAWHVVH
jgi:hypothetical protein